MFSNHQSAIRGAAAADGATKLLLFRDSDFGQFREFFYFIFKHELEAVGNVVAVVPVHHHAFKALAVLLTGCQRAIAFRVFGNEFFYCLGVHIGSYGSLVYK